MSVVPETSGEKLSWRIKPRMKLIDPIAELTATRAFPTPVPERDRR
jgi:hypothetical protein